MGTERERRFLCRYNPCRKLDPNGGIPRSIRIQQNYLSKDDQSSVRVRVISDPVHKSETAFLTVKSSGVIDAQAKVRQEFEYPIPLPDARYMLGTCKPQGIIKDRFVWTEHEDPGTWEINEYMGPNSGIILAELEFDENAFTGYGVLGYTWIEREVTREKKFSDAYLASNPGWWKKTPWWKIWE